MDRKYIKIYHLFPDEKYVDDFISKVLASSARPDQNVFIVRAEKPFSRVKQHADTVIEAPLFSAALSALVDNMTNKDLFLVHYLERNVCEWLNQVDRELFIGWVFWGSELFNNAGINYPLYGPETRKIYRPNLLEQSWLYHFPFYREIELFYERYIKAPRMRRLKGKTFARLSYFLNYNKYNYEIVKDNFETPAEFVYFIYPRIFDVPDFVKEVNPPFLIEKEKINVLVGNSANYPNNHLDVFEKITPHESLVVWVPLSYGDPDYARTIQRAGRKKFGFNFRVLTDYLPSDQYFGFLRQMDAGIFGNYRPMAMGNITTLLSLGKEVVMEKRNPSTKDLRDRGFSLITMEHLSTELLLALDERPNTKNMELAKIHFYGDEIAECYRKLF